MVGSLVTRVLAALLLLPAGLAASATAVSHGAAHHRLHHDEQPHHLSVELAWSPGDVGGSEHPHVTLGRALRPDVPAALPAVAVAAIAAPVCGGVVLRVPVEPEPVRGVDCGTGPPPRLRAPPHR